MRKTGAIGILLAVGLLGACAAQGVDDGTLGGVHGKADGTGIAECGLLEQEAWAAAQTLEPNEEIAFIFAGYLNQECNADFAAEMETRMQARLEELVAGGMEAEEAEAKAEIDVFLGPVADRFFRPTIYLAQLASGTGECIADAREELLYDVELGDAEGDIEDAIDLTQEKGLAVCAEMAGIPVDEEDGDGLMAAIACGQTVEAVNMLGCATNVERKLASVINTYLLGEVDAFFTAPSGLAHLEGVASIPAYAEAANTMCDLFLTNNTAGFEQSHMENLKKGCTDSIEELFRNMPAQMADGSLVDEDVWSWLGVHPGDVTQENQDGTQVEEATAE